MAWSDGLRGPRSEPALYAVAPAIELPPGAHERQSRLRERAIEVFGDLDITWLYRSDPWLGLDETGAPTSPHRFVADGEEQLRAVLAVLEDLSTTVTPQWDPRPSKARERARKASRSRGR